MQASAPADPDSPLRPVGFALGAATAVAHLALTVLSLRRSCRRYGDLLHGLCLHAGLVGCLQAGLVFVPHALLHSSQKVLDQPLWRACCKLYLFCRIFLPGLFLYLTAAITVCFRSVRYPPRRCGRSCTRLGYLTAHCLPWAACSAGLLPVLMLHKDGTEVALRAEGRCLLVERWAWLGPISILLGAPLLASLVLTCLLCAYKPYRSSRESSINGGSSADSGELADDFDDDAEQDDDPRRHNSHGDRRDNHQHSCLRQPSKDSDASQGNGFDHQRRAGSTVILNQTASHATAMAGRGSRYYADSRLLRGPPMRLARSLLLTMSLLQAGTQLPHCITAVLQTVLRNLQSRQPIQQSALDALYWIHLVYFPLSGLLLTAFVLQLHRAFRLTETDIEREMQTCCSTQPGVSEVLQTTSMLTSL